MRDLHYDGLKHPARGRVYENDKMVDIKDIILNSVKDIKFISADGKDLEFCINDFIYLIMPKETLQTLIEEAYQQGVNDGKKFKNRRPQEEEPVIVE